MTTPVLNDLVREYWSGSEWFLTFEVGNGTGFTVKRHADAVAMNLWPSRGLALHGIEIKASRGDWQKELSNPEKAEEIHRHCDYWWLVTAHGVVKDIGEIPAGWGWMEMGKFDAEDPDAKRPRLRLKRQAVKLERADTVDRGFVAAILRAQQRADAVEHSRAVQAQVDRIVEQRVERVVANQKQLASEAVSRLEKLSSACADLGWLDNDEICRAVAFVLKTGAAASYQGIAGLISHFKSAETSARRAVAELEDATAAIGMPVGDEEESQRALPFRKARQ